MQLRDRLGSAIVLMIIVLMWTLLLGVGGWMLFGFLADAIGLNATIVLFGLGIGAAVAIGMWIASSMHTRAIFRSALSFAADSQQMAAEAQRSLVSVQREDARAARIRTQAAAQIDVTSYRAALTDARQQVRQELRQEQVQAPPARSWAMADDDEGGGGFRWEQ
jgi:hypothetical protein